MSLEFFDANVFIGRPVVGIPKFVDTADELADELDARGISGALVWHVDQYGHIPAAGNELIAREVSRSDRFWGCWTILPPQTGEVIGTHFFEDMKKNRIAALRAFPTHHNYLLNRQVFGGFLDEVCERRIPLLLSVSGMWGGISWPAIYKLMDDYPQLTCVLCDIGVWPTDRYWRPLLEGYPNFYIETSLLSLGARVVEDMVAKYGARRLVFGTGFPMRYPEAPMLQLVHAEISDKDRTMIAHGNLESLVSEVKL